MTFVADVYSFFTFVDPWADASKGVDETSKQEQPIHIRIQQRSGRKTLTTVQGIDDYYDKKKLVKVFKKVSFDDRERHYGHLLIPVCFIKAIISIFIFSSQ